MQEFKKRYVDPITNSPTNYFITVDGKVFNQNDMRMKTHTDRDGYELLSLKIGNRYRTTRVHRMIGLMFLIKEDGKDFINHIDGNKSNNHIDNLEWCDVKHNNRHALRTGLRVGQNGGMNKLTDEQVVEVFNLRNSGLKHSYIADYFGVSRTAITLVLSRASYRHVIVPVLMQKDRVYG